MAAPRGGCSALQRGRSYSETDGHIPSCDPRRMVVDWSNNEPCWAYLDQRRVPCRPLGTDSVPADARCDQISRGARRRRTGSWAWSPRTRSTRLACDKATGAAGDFRRREAAVRGGLRCEAMAEPVRPWFIRRYEACRTREICRRDNPRSRWSRWGSADKGFTGTAAPFLSMEGIRRNGGAMGAPVTRLCQCVRCCAVDRPCQGKLALGGR